MNFRCVFVLLVLISGWGPEGLPLAAAKSWEEEALLFRFATKSARVVWNSTVPKGTHGANRPESPNPDAVSALDEHRYYVVNRQRQVNAYDRNTGKLLWQVPGGQVTAVPALEMLIVEYEGNSSGLHAANGSAVWSYPNTDIIRPYIFEGRYAVFNNVTSEDQFIFTMIDVITGSVAWIANVTGGVTSPPHVCAPGISVAQSDDLAFLGTYGIDLSDGQPVWFNADVYGQYLGCATTAAGHVAFLTNTVEMFVGSIAAVNAQTGVLLFNITGEFAKRVTQDHDVFTQSHFLCTETSTRYATPSESVLQCWDGTNGALAWSWNVTGIVAQNECQQAFPFGDGSVIFACQAFSGAVTNVSAYRVSDGKPLWTRFDIPQSGRYPGVFSVGDYVWVRSDDGFTAVNQRQTFALSNGAHDLRELSIQLDASSRSVYFATEWNAMRLDF